MFVGSVIGKTAIGKSIVLIMRNAKKFKRKRKMSKSINIRNFDEVNKIVDLISNHLFPPIRNDIKQGVSRDDLYATLLDKMGRKRTVKKMDVMWATYVACFAIAHRIISEEKAGELAI